MSAITRCKVKCTEIGQRVNGNELVHTAKFSAIYDSNPESENGKFFKWTPSMNVDLGVIKTQHFEAGKDYYLDFVAVEAK